MGEEPQTDANKYMDGTVVCEIEHLLVINLHHLNTIEEIEILKAHFHHSMMTTYNKGQARDTS